MVVVDPTSLGNLTLSSGTRNFVYDAERRAMLMFRTDTNLIERHVYNGSSWSSTSATPPHSLSTAVLSPDGDEIVGITQDDRIVRFSAATLGVISETAALTTYPTDLLSITGANDGRMVIGVGNSSGSQLYRYNLLSGTYGARAGTAATTPPLSVVRRR